jgi:exodeoxyribonuclease X
MQNIHEAIICDTETTGLTSADKMFEYARLALPALEELLRAQPIYTHPKIEPYCSIWNPGVDIHPQATAVHGHTKESLAHHPAVENFQREETRFIIGHNVDFDCRFIGEETAKRICTIRLAKLVWPKNPAGITSYKLTYLIEHLIPRGKRLAQEAHGALPDCYLTLLLLDKILEKLPRITSWEELYQFQIGKAIPSKTSKTAKQSLMEVMPFGKHKGELFCDIPRDYLKWLQNQELSPKLRTAVEAAYGLK